MMILIACFEDVLTTFAKAGPRAFKDAAATRLICQTQRRRLATCAWRKHHPRAMHAMSMLMIVAVCDLIAALAAIGLTGSELAPAHQKVDLSARMISSLQVLMSPRLWQRGKAYALSAEYLTLHLPI